MYLSQPWPPFGSAATQKEKGSRGSFTLLRQRLQQRKTTITPQDRTKPNTTKHQNKSELSKTDNTIINKTN